MLVFTQYDRLVRTKQFQLRATPDIDAATLDRLSVEGAQEVFNTCLESLKVTTDNLVIPMPTLAKVSGIFTPTVLIGIDHLLVRPGYEKDVSFLVRVTTDVARDRVKGDAWVLWSMAQRASLPIKIETCITYVFSDDPIHVYSRLESKGINRMYPWCQLYIPEHQDFRLFAGHGGYFAWFWTVDTP